MDIDAIETIEDSDLTDEKLLKDFEYSSLVLGTLKSYLLEIGKYKVLQKDDLISLIKRYKNGETYLRDDIINANLRLVVAVVKRMKLFKNSEDFLDCIQSGNIGLMIALEKFNPDLGYSFSTYAIHWIQQKVYINCIEYGETIRIPVHLLEHVFRYRKFMNEFVENHKKYPTKEQILEALGIKENILNGILMANEINGNISSLNEIMYTDDRDKTEVQSFVPIEENGYEKVEKAWRDKILLVNLKNNLKPFYYYVIYSRFLKDPGMTLEEIGNEFSLSRERIRQLESKALRKAKPELSNISQNPGYDYNIPMEELIPISYKKRVILYYLKNNLNSLDYYLVFNFVYGHKKIETVFSNIDIEKIEWKINDLNKKYRYLFSDDRMYFEICKNLEADRDTIFEFDINPISISEDDINNMLDSIETEGKMLKK